MGFLGQVQEGAGAGLSRKEVLDVAVGLSSCGELPTLCWMVRSTLGESPISCVFSQTEGPGLCRCARCLIHVEHGAPGGSAVRRPELRLGRSGMQGSPSYTYFSG